MKSKDALAKNAAKKRASTSSKAVSKQNIPYAKSKKPSKKTTKVLNEYAPTKTGIQSQEFPNQSFINEQDGTITAIFNNKSILKTGQKLNETLNEIIGANQSFEIKFNKLEAETKVFELKSKKAKIDFQFIDKTPNKKNPAHRPLSLKGDHSIFWKNVDNKTNITFDISSKKIRQNIEVKKKNEKYDYSIILNTHNLTSKFEPNSKTLQLIDEEKNLFSISAPTLTDSLKNKFEVNSFEVREAKNGKTEISFTFDADKINKNVRFPVTINPEFIVEDVSIIKFQYFSKAIDAKNWTAGPISSTMKFSRKADLEKNILTINKDSLSITQDQKIFGVYVKIEADTVKDFQINDRIISIPEEGFGFLDITKEYFETKDREITLELRPIADEIYGSILWREREELPKSIYEAKARRDIQRILHHTLEPNDIDDKWPIVPGDVIVKYFIDDEMMPSSESYALAGGVETSVTLDTGDAITSFDDIALISTSLPFKISHTYKQGNSDFGCGNNWRLNLHQKLTRGSSKNNGSDYIYTDGNGFQHGFIETYYYFDADGEKTVVNKNNVVFDFSGSMYYEISGKKCEVFKEQRSTSGLQLTTRIEGFKGIEYYEQRQQEEKQLEDTIYSYKNNLCEYVITDNESGSIKNELKSFFKNGILSVAEFKSFKNCISSNMLLQKQEAIQLQSLYAQKKIYSNQVNINKKQKESYDKDYDTAQKSFNVQENSLTIQKESLYNSLLSLERDWNAAGEACDSLKVRQLDNLYWQKKLLWGNDYVDSWDNYYLIKEKIYYFTRSKFDAIKSIFSSIVGVYISSFEELQKYKYQHNYSKINTDHTQKKLLTTQKSNESDHKDIQDLLTNNSSNEEQIKLIEEQINYIKENNDKRVEELEKTYKDYINYEYNLIKLKRNIITASLSDGNKSLCFNQYGDLCAITDSYGNFTAIEYDNLNDRISKINDGKKTISFKYNYHGLLTSITDYNGNRVEYMYSSTSKNANLTEVKLPNGDSIHFDYTDNNITTIASDIEHVKSKLNYSITTSTPILAQLISITNYSLVTKITNKDISISSSINADSKNTFSQIEFTYGLHECTITNEGKAKRYFMDDRGCLIGGYAQNDEGILGAFSYAHTDREKNESFSIHEIDDAVATSSNETEQTIQGTDLPHNHKEYMFSALITCAKRQVIGIARPQQNQSTNEIGFELIPHTISDDYKENLLPRLYEPREIIPTYSFIDNIEHHFFQQNDSYISEKLFSTNITRKKINTNDSFIGLQATVQYSNNTSETFKMPALQRSSGTQLCALPISLNLTKNVTKITLSLVNTTDTTVFCKLIRLAPAECKNEKFDNFKNIIRSESSYNFVCSSGIKKSYRKSITNYKYNEQHSLLEKRTICTDYSTQLINLLEVASPNSVESNELKRMLEFSKAKTNRQETHFFLGKIDSQHLITQYTETDPTVFTNLFNSTEQPLILGDNSIVIATFKETTTCITKYKHNDKEAQLSEEAYIEGEEASRGVMVDENIYDDKGRTIKTKLYNNLESSNKQYTEKDYNENSNLVQSELDALGENKTFYEYDPITQMITTVTYPSGSKLTYSRDSNTHTTTGISQSTEDGEANSIETQYNCGLITKHTSETNSIDYEYNGKREKTAVYFNDIKKADYKHEKNVILDNKTTEKTTVTLWGNSDEKIITEAYIDSKKNIIQTTLNGNILFKNRYSKTNDLLESQDFITKITTSTNYDEINQRYASVTKSAGTGEYSFLDSIKETYTYNDFGNVLEHSIFIGENVNKGTPNHKYKFEYNSDTAHTLKSIILPNGFTFKPQKDFMGRDNGKTLLNENGERIFGEYISFRKVGDHTSNMIASISYGERQNGKYSISEGIRYKYDMCGNITEKWEHGVFASAYAYDHLNRLIREDNAILQKTWILSYDKNGNRTTKIALPFTRKKTSEITDYTDAIVERYSYDGDMLVSTNEKSFHYDGFGNPLNFKGNKLIWEKNKLIKFGDLVFDYDGYGKRIRKGSTYFTYDIDNKLVQMKKDGKYLYFIYDDRGISGITYQDQQFILRKNAQGDIADIFSSNGEHIVHYEYDAWGNHKVIDDNGNEITDSDHIGIMNPFRYRGYFYDEETSLYYLINRYYDPEIGRFISQDQISYLQPETINGLNLFAYCDNNPIMKIDEDGCIPKWLKKIGLAIEKGFKAIGSAVKKACMVVAGAVMAVVGFAVAAVAFVASLPTLIPGFSSIPGLGKLASITGDLYQKGMSLGFYGGFMAAAAFSKDIYNDMSAISWNPFNTNEDKVLNSKYVSFYKGLPVIRSNTDRSGNLGVIILNRMDENYKNRYGMDRVDVLRHEYGHSAQIAILGPTNYFISVGIPSWKEWGNDDYYSNPWENMANEIGGVKAGTVYHQQNQKFIMKCYILGFCSLF